MCKLPPRQHRRPLSPARYLDAGFYPDDDGDFDNTIPVYLRQYGRRWVNVPCRPDGLLVEELKGGLRWMFLRGVMGRMRFWRAFYTRDPDHDLDDRIIYEIPELPDNERAWPGAWIAAEADM